MAPNSNCADPEGLAAALEDLRAGGQDVGLVFFGREGLPAAAVVRDLAVRVAQAGHPRIGLELYEIGDQAQIARSFRVRRAPCLAIVGPGGDTGIRFYGSIQGFGVTGLVAALRIAAGADPGLPPDARARLGELVEPARLRLFVAHEDEDAVALMAAAAAVAIASPFIRVDIYNAPEFRPLAQALGARGFPELLLGGRALRFTTSPVVLADEILRASVVVLDVPQD